MRKPKRFAGRAGRIGIRLNRVTDGSGPARISRRLRLEALEDRRLLSLSNPANLTDDPNQVEPDVDANTVDVNRASNAGIAAKGVSGEILVAFDGDVAASFRTQGAAKALEMAGKIVGPQGLRGGRVLFHAPAGNGFGERVVTQWKYDGGVDDVKAIGRLKGVVYAEPNGVMSIQAHLDSSNPGDPSFQDPSG